MRFTFIVKIAIKVIAAGVEAGGELNEMASPGVTSSWETGESHQLLSPSLEQHYQTLTNVGSESLWFHHSVVIS